MYDLTQTHEILSDATILLMDDRSYRIISVPSYDECMDFCLAWIQKNCPTLYALKDWKLSNGAKKEIALAEELGLEVIYEE